jgi:hypothetical protein
MTMQQVEAYLARYGIPKQMIKKIRLALIYDAVTEGKDLKYDRIYTGIALAARRAYGFGPERILRLLREFDSICGSVLDDGEHTADPRDWTDIMQELKDETGIVINTGEDNRLICEVSRE